jgi:hypothetical protein
LLFKKKVQKYLNIFGKIYPLVLNVKNFFFIFGGLVVFYVLLGFVVVYYDDGLLYDVGCIYDGVMSFLV